MSRSFHLPAVSDALPVAGHPGDALDTRLGGRLGVGLHEAFADFDDRGAGLGFVVMLALRSDAARPIVWIREAGAAGQTRLHGGGLMELGCDPSRLLLVDAPDPVAMLRAAREAMGCPAVAAVIMESRGRVGALDLTATRRLHLTAVAAGVLALSLRHVAEPCPSAALTRWRVAAAPSRPLAALSPGPPRLALSLLRRRGGIAGLEMLVEWDRDRRAFIAPGKAYPGAVPAALPGRADAATVVAFRRRAA